MHSQLDIDIGIVIIRVYSIHTTTHYVPRQIYTNTFVHACKIILHS